MKITIELSINEVKGLKAYLKAMDEPATKQAIQQHVQEIVRGNLNSPQEAVSQYIAEQSL